MVQTSNKLKMKRRWLWKVKIEHTCNGSKLKVSRMLNKVGPRLIKPLTSKGFIISLAERAGLPPLRSGDPKEGA
jgi:hypothetical protein